MLKSLNDFTENINYLKMQTGDAKFLNWCRSHVRSIFFRKVTKITKYNGWKRDLLKSFVEWTLNIERNNFKQNHYSDRLSTIEKTDTVSPKESRMSVNLKSDVK